MTDTQLESAIGQVLRAGVLLAALIVLVGAVLFLSRASGMPRPDYSRFQGESSSLTTLAGITAQAWHGNGLGLIQFGLLTLIATPIVRVLLALVGFSAERDWLYAGVSIAVLAVLLYSILSVH